MAPRRRHGSDNAPITIGSTLETHAEMQGKILPGAQTPAKARFEGSRPGQRQARAGRSRMTRTSSAGDNDQATPAAPDKQGRRSAPGRSTAGTYYQEENP